MKKQRIGYVIYLSVIFAILFAILEVGTRYKHGKAYLAGNVDKDRIFHHLPPPNSESPMYSEGDFDYSNVTNNRGMRGPHDYFYAKPEGVTRIAVMGDSFIFGVGVHFDEVFTTVLERLLNKTAVKKYQVYNFGVPSYSPVIQSVYLKREIVRYAPNVLILMLDLCDIQDDYFYEPHLVYDESGEAIAVDPYRLNGRPDIWAILKKHSAFLTMLDVKVLQSFRKMQTLGFMDYFWNKFKGVRNKTEILLNTDIDNIFFDRFMFTREDKDPSILKPHWERTAKYVKKIKEVCDRHGIEFVLAAYPYGHQVGTNQWRKGRRYWAFDPDHVYDATRTFSMIREFTATDDIDFISLYGPFLKNADQKLFFHNDGHWTAKGHLLAADAVFGSDIFKSALE